MFTNLAQNLLMKRLFQIAITLSLLAFLFSCQPDEFTTDSSARLSFSADTITFDTIFTTIGSVTKSFKIYNDNDYSINISSIYLKEGQTSNYRVNLDGQSGYSFADYEIAANDSIYVFVEVTLDPNDGYLPLVVEDALVFNSNGNSDLVLLESFGQDVHLIDELSLTSTETWANDKPYLILEGLFVDTNAVLTIEPGVRVYFHDNAYLYVWGQLQVEGTKEEPVVFEGDRFDMGYDRSAGRWATIQFSSISRGNSIDYAIIRNPELGILIGHPLQLEDTPQLSLSNTIIQNAVSAHIVAYGAEITANNCVFADAENHSLFLVAGGKYNFNHCTSSIPGAFRVDAGVFENYQRSDGYALNLANNTTYTYTDEDNITSEVLFIRDLEEANFNNCIFWGSHSEEFITSNNEEGDFNYYFNHCILKQTEDSIDINDSKYYNNVVLNEYPLFVNDSATYGNLDLRLETLSPAIDAGNMEIINLNAILEYDLDGALRTEDGSPDLGAYERYE